MSPRGKERETYKYYEKGGADSESINCCQLDIHKALIRERKASKYDATTPENIFGKRSCTDVLCLVLFFVAFVAWIVISVVVFRANGPQRLLAPVDSNNKRCGYDRGVENRPNLFFFDVTKCLSPQRSIFRCETKQVCVSECPKTNFSAAYYMDARESVSAIKDKLICADGFEKDFVVNSYRDVRSAIDNGFCAAWYLESEPTLGLCLPRHRLDAVESQPPTTVHLAEGVDVEIVGVTNRLIRSGVYAIKRNQGFFHQLGRDLDETWPYIVALSGLAVAVSFLYIIIMRWLCWIMVWGSLVALIGFLGFSSYYTWTKYEEAKSTQGALSKYAVVNLSAVASEVRMFAEDLARHEYTWLTLFVISVVMLALVVILLLFLRNRLSLAVRLITEGSKAVCHAWSSLLFPLFPLVLQILILVQAAAVFLCLIGQKVPVNRVVGLNGGSTCTCDGYKEGDVCDVDAFQRRCRDAYGNRCLAAHCTYSGMESDDIAIYVHLFNIFMFLWCEYFILGFGDMSLAMTFATYYWTRIKRKLPFCIVGASICRVIRYHLGTVAFGSFLLALLNWMRVLVELAYRYTNKYNNPLTTCLRCCCGCFLACLHKILRILTKNAYIMCAMRGSNYCASAKHAFNLIIQNILRASVLDGVTTFLFFLMKLLITASMGAIAYVIFSKPLPDLRTLRDSPYDFEYYFAPIIIVCVASFLIATLFFNVYSAAVDTLFLCALEDLNVNDGSPEKPYAMSKSLIKIFDVKNRRST